MGMAGAVLVFGGECLFWLKAGYWPGWTLADQLGYPLESRYVGLNKIVKWYFDQRLSAAIFYGSTAIFLISTYGSVALEER